MIHYFNPGNETAILNGSPYYTPAANQVKMHQDLAFLPAWYACYPNDIIWVEKDLPDEFKSIITGLNVVTKVVTSEKLKDCQAEVKNSVIDLWGPALHDIRFFEKISRDFYLDFILPEWKTEFPALCHRNISHRCLEFLIQSEVEIEPDILPRSFFRIEDIENELQQSHVALLAKAPYSSSGRGLQWLPPGELHQSEKQIISGILKKQKSVSLEKVLDKKIDFAMLFYSNDMGTVDFIGFSLFETNNKGAYSRNIILSQRKIKQLLEEYVGTDILERVKNQLIIFLNKTFTSAYKGCIGVDMMIYSDNNGYKLHPCVEINMRKSMGFLSLRLYQNHCCENSSGIFSVEFNNHRGEILNNHRKNTETYPLKIENGKIKSGYLSLCPVDEETKYLAYVLIDSD